MTSTILLTGGTGFVGGHLRAALQDTPVILLGRRAPILRPNERYVYLDLKELVEPAELNGGSILCHLAYSHGAGRRNIAFNRHLLDAVNASPDIEHVVLMSSTSVYGGNTAPVVCEESSCRPVGEYAEIKMACEILWWEGLREDCGMTVLRPATVVGPDGEGLHALVRDAVYRPLVGAFKRSVLQHHPVHFVAMSNVVAATCFSLQRLEPALRRAYIISDDHYPENESYAVMQDAVREISGLRPLPSLAVPRPILRLLGAVFGRAVGITGPALGLKQIYSSRRIHAAGFEDAVTLRDEVRRMVECYEKFD